MKKGSDIKEQMIRILSTVPGLIGLGGSIGLLQNLARESTNKVDNLVFVDNWIPWIAVLIFALGWFMAHAIEIALQNKQTKTVKGLLIVLLIEFIILSVYFRFFVDHEMLHRFSFAVPSLFYSGVFLRYSMISKEAIATQQKIFLGEKFEASGKN